MIHFMNFFKFALVVGGMEAIQPAAAAVLANLSPETNFGLMNTFHRRQGGAPPPPPQCATICNPVANVISNPQSCTASPTVCCSASFEESYFNCDTCVNTAVNITDFTQAQATLDTLYDDCAEIGIQLPVLTFPGQNPNRTLSSVVISTSTVSSITSLPAQSITQSTVGPSTSSTPTTSSPATAPSQSTVTTVTSVNTPTPTSSSASSTGIRSVEKSCFNMITVITLLGTWLYFGVY